MAMDYFNAFDPMDPLDAMIMSSPEYDHIVDNLQEQINMIAEGKDGIYESVYNTDTIGLDQFEAEDDADVGYSDDGDSIDNYADPITSDAADYGAAEMELLNGEFSNNAYDSIDDIEFTGMD
jgi:hypothetical protein